MNAATVDQAESMYKNLTNLKQSPHKCFDEDLDIVEIDDDSCDINEKMDEWIRKYVCQKTK